MMLLEAYGASGKVTKKISPGPTQPTKAASLNAGSFAVSKGLFAVGSDFQDHLTDSEKCEDCQDKYKTI